MSLRQWNLLSAACIYLCVPLTFSAQDTVAIEAVAVNARKASLGQAGRKVESVDSSFRQQFRYNMLTDVLGAHSAAHFRTYGNGGISMAGLRGASVEQTAVLWNGVNLQNTMLGLTDLSMVPNILFESVAIEYGSSGAMWGSGAVGGSVHLDNAARIGRQFKVSTGLAAGSLSQLNTVGVITAGNSRMVNVLKIYTTRSRNRFRYYHEGNGREDTMMRASFQGHGLMNEFRARLGSRSLITVNAWLSGSDRQLPGYDPSVLSKQYQDDAAMRFQGAWVYTAGRLRAQLRTAYFNERVGYTDSLAEIRNINRAQTFMTDAEQFFRWGGGQELHAGLSMLRTAGHTENYESAAMLSRFSVLAGNRFSFAEDRLRAVVNARAEYISAGTLPLTGNAGVEYRPFVWLKLGTTVNTSYRQPTLNELYWMPGGNPDLRAERSQGADANLSLYAQNKYTRAGFTLAVYTRTVNDWIVWIPGRQGQPTPQNIQQVWSRGAETTWWADFRSGQKQAGFRAVTSYVLSTVRSTYSQNSASIGKQLIYTPRYMVNGHVYAGYKDTRLYLIAQYAGYRFTTSDNSSWLEPYLLLSARATHEFRGAGLRFTLFAACNNLVNQNYVVMEGRWMPLRNYEFGVTIHFNKNQKHENTKQED